MSLRLSLLEMLARRLGAGGARAEESAAAPSLREALAQRAASSGRVTVFRGEPEYPAGSQAPEWGAFYTESPDVANTHAMHYPPGGDYVQDAPPHGGRLFRDTLDPSDFESWDLQGDAPTHTELLRRAIDARRRNIPGITLENVQDIATPVDAPSSAHYGRQYLVLDKTRLANAEAPELRSARPPFDAGQPGLGRTPSTNELARMATQARRANPSANAEDINTIRWVQDADGNYHLVHALESDHAGLWGQLRQRGVNMPSDFPTKDNRDLRGFFRRDENGRWESVDMNGTSAPLSPTPASPEVGAAGNGRELPFDETQTLHRYGPLEVNPNGAHGPGIYFANSPETAQRGLWEGLGARGQYPARLSDSATLSSGHARGPFAPVSRYRALTDAGKTPAEAVAALRADGYRGIRDGRTGFTSVFDASDFRPAPGAPARDEGPIKPNGAAMALLAGGALGGGLTLRELLREQYGA